MLLETLGLYSSRVRKLRGIAFTTTNELCWERSGKPRPDSEAPQKQRTTPDRNAPINRYQVSFQAKDQPKKQTMIDIPTSPITTMTLLQTPQTQDENKMMLDIPTKLWHLRPPSQLPIIKARKKVRFAVKEEISPSSKSPLLRLPVDEWKSLWYSPEELHAIKTAVYLVCRQLKQYLKNNPNPSLAVSDETRGLEQRCCMERQRRKYLTLRYILKVSRHPDMSRRASICSQWASQLACIQGQRDHATLKRTAMSVEASLEVLSLSTANKRIRR